MADHIKLLDQLDTAFGWSAVSFRLTKPWRNNATEVTAAIDKQIEAYQQRQAERKGPAQ
jgi:hypothetical protein